MYKKVLIFIIAICAIFLSCSTSMAEEPTEYSMLYDEVSGENIESFFIARPNPESIKGNIVYASQFGMDPANSDNHEAFQNALNYCSENPNTYLVIDKGIYYFRTDESLRFNGLENVLVEANGADFIFKNQKQFIIDGCNGLEIHDLIVDWNWAEDRIASLVQVQNVTDQSFEIKFLELDDVDVDIPLVSFQQYDSREYVPGSYGLYKSFAPAEVPGSVTGVEKIEPNVLKLYISDKFTTSFQNEDVYILRHYTYGGATFNTVGASSNITYNGVRIYGSAGMGFVFGEKSNHFQIINSYIGLRPGSEDQQRMATTADGIHILNTGGFFRIDNCDFSYTGDDIINIHDDMFKVNSVDSEYQLSGVVTGGFVKKGDKVRFKNLNIEDYPDFESEVVNFIRSSSGDTLVLKDKIPSDITQGFFVYCSSSSTHNYVISNNYIHETKGRAALLNGADGLFVNNRLYRTVSECVQVRIDLADRNDKIWYEGTGSKNVTIKNNTFEECAFGGKDSIITIDCNIGNNKCALSDVHIIENEFKYCYGKLIEADNVSDLYVQFNTVIDCGEICVSNDCGAIYISDNTITKPSETCPHTDTKQVLNRQPGCYKYGSTGKTYCNQCHTISDNNYIGISPLNHKNLIVKRIDIAPTCTESGLSSNVCSLCRTVMETGIVEPATGHTYVAVTDGSADSVESSDANASGANASGKNASDPNASGSRYHKCTECGILEEHTSGTGGVCTVCGYGKKVEVVKMSLELSTATMEYIGVNLYVDAPSGTVFYLDGQIYEQLEKDSIGLNKIQYKCAPKELADKHILTTADSSGNSLCITDTANDVYEYIYSGEMYCKYIVAAGSEYSDKLKSVCKSLIDYSETARVYFEYNNDNLVTGDISAKLPSSGYAMKITGELPSGCYYLGSSLVLGDEVKIRHYFTGNANRFVISCTNTTKKIAAPIVIGEVASTSAFYIDIPVAYTNVRDMFEVRFAVAGTSPYTLRYGVATYSYEAREKKAEGVLVNLCNALYNLAVAVANYS